MTEEQKAKRGRPAKQVEDRHLNRIVMMADDETRNWLTWHSTETGLSISDILRRALVAFRNALKGAVK